MDNALGMDVPDRAQHLLHQACALGLGVVIVGLLIETIEKLATQTQFLDKVDFGVGLVHLLKTDDVGVIELAHDVDLLSELLESLLGFHEAEVETFHSIFDTGGFVRNEPNEAGNARSEDGAVMHAIINFLNWLAKRYLGRLKPEDK